MSVALRSYINKFNRGEIDSLALARDDVEKIRNSAALMENWMPIRLGAMMYRPGTEYLGAPAGQSYFIPFVAATNDTALMEFSNNLLRIWVDDALVTRSAVTTAIANGTFTTDLTGWTSGDEAGATSAWATGGYLGLTGTGTNSAIRYQTLTTETGVEHGIRIVVYQSPITLKLGTTGASSTDIFEGELKPGTHCLVFTPTSNVTVTFSNAHAIVGYVDSVAFDAAGTLTIPTSVGTSSLALIRSSQSADVVFCAYDTGKPFCIERRGVKSWSIVDYRVDDGPFNVINTTGITLTAAALTGNTTLTASKSYFKTTDVGRLYKLISSGQTVTHSVTAQDTGTNSILDSGVSSSRQFTISVTGLSGTGSTITLQRSTDDLTWVDVESYTTDQSKAYNDTFDNSLLYYRLWCKTGDYSTGTIVCSLDFSGGSVTGIGRATAYNSTTSVSVEVLQDFGSTSATRDWYAGTWNDADGYPTATSIYEGRVWWGGKSKLWGTGSDAYYSLDTGTAAGGDSIQKTIGFGPVDSVSWLLTLNRLLIGIASDEISVRSDSYGTILTPTNTNLKGGTSQGAATIAPTAINSRGYFVQRSGEKIFQLEYSLNQDMHEALDLCVLNPSICSAGIKRIAVTMQPEVRIYVVLNNGEGRVYLMDPTENVQAWSRITTDGTIEDVVVLPSTGEDRVYFVINRTGGRYLEKMALFSESIGGTTSKTFDSFKTYTSPGATISDLAHLEGKTVGVWADGQYRESHTVTSGTITLSSAAWTSVVIGLRYTAPYNSSKLNGWVQETVLNELKRVVNVGFVLQNYWPGSLSVGPDSATLDSFPTTEGGTVVNTTVTMSAYDESPFPFDGSSGTDPRIYLEANNPVTILAMTYGIEQARDIAPAPPGRTSG